MPQAADPDHDQRLKVLLKEVFEAFFLGFFPDWAARFEFTDIDWLDKELFLAAPDGERRQLDLVARLKLRPGAPPPREGVNDLVALVHVEIESRDSIAAFRPRMIDYYVQLRRDRLRRDPPSAQKRSSSMVKQLGCFDDAGGSVRFGSRRA
jgi:hypothetical protein